MKVEVVFVLKGPQQGSPQREPTFCLGGLLRPPLPLSPQAFKGLGFVCWGLF